jgi:hypothetical protein
MTSRQYRNEILETVGSGYTPLPGWFPCRDCGTVFYTLDKRADEVHALNLQQKRQDRHPLTCGHCRNKLVATAEHWICVNGDCRYTQPYVCDAKPSHYAKCAIDPWIYAMRNGLDALQFSVVKYVTRFRDKGGIEDLKKCRDSLDRLIAFEEAKAAN